MTYRALETLFKLLDSQFVYRHWQTVLSTLHYRDARASGRQIVALVVWCTRAQVRSPSRSKGSLVIVRLVVEMSSYMPAVCFSKNQQIFIKVGPDPKDDAASAFADTDRVEMQLEYCCYDRRDDADHDDDTDNAMLEWKLCKTVFHMTPRADTKYPLFDLRSERPEAGHRYLFRIFMKESSTGQTTPPSQRSAVICLLDDDE